MGTVYIPESTNWIDMSIKNPSAYVQLTRAEFDRLMRDAANYHDQRMKDVEEIAFLKSAQKTLGAERDAARIESESNKRSALLFELLETLCGHWQDGSSQTVKIFQDDATREFILNVGKRQYTAGSLAGAITEAASK